MNKFTVKIDNQKFESFETISVVKSLDDLVGVANLGVTLGDSQGTPTDFALKRRKEIEVFIDGKRIFTGFITAINASDDANSTNIDITAKEKTVDIIESDLLDVSSVGTPIRLAKLIEDVFSKNSIDLKVIDNTNEDLLIKELEAIQPEEKIKVWDFITRYINKKSVLATTNASGNLELTQNNKGKLGKALIRQLNNSNNNNILSAKFSNNSDNLYNLYVAVGQLKASEFSEGFENQEGVAVDNDIRTSRALRLSASTNLTASDAEKLSEWYRNVNKARSVIYSANVLGFHIDRLNQSSDLWELNKLARVNDEKYGVNKDMLIKGITYNDSVNRGAITTLELVDKSAYLPEPIIETDNVF